MNIGQSIKNHRKRLKLSREALATRAGVSERSLYSYESNKQSPTLTQIEVIARALKVTPSELLDDSFKINRKMPEEEIIDEILSLRHRKDIRAAGVVKIISKVLQQLPLESKS
jgi:transcriptional regulator with XRE-family HTH domain